MAVLWLVGMLVGCGLLLTAMAVSLLAQRILMPPRMTDGKAAWVLRRIGPGDFGFEFEDVSFTVRAQTGNLIKIAAWWIPCPQPTSKTVLMLHGYADAKVGAIAWAPLWRQMGFHILAIDLRAHGESGGKYCTGGLAEIEDVRQVIDQIRIARRRQTSELVIFGASFGGLVAMGIAAGRDDLLAIVLDSPIACFARSAQRQMDRRGAPGKWFQQWATWLAGKISGSDLQELRAERLLENIHCPVMLIAPGRDHTLARGDGELLANAMTRRAARFARDRYWAIPQGEHLLVMAEQPEEYTRQLADFLRPGLTQ